MSPFLGGLGMMGGGCQLRAEPTRPQGPSRSYPLLVLDGHFTFRWACVITQECLADGMGGSSKPWSRLPLGFTTPPQPRAASPWALLPPCYENPVGPKDALLFPSYR